MTTTTTSTTTLPIPADRLVHREVLRGGQYWSRRLLRNQVLRLLDVEGHACVSGMFWNARETLERYNMPDTLKAQYTAFLTTGRVLYSDMGRVLLSVVGDTCGWHDTISGCGDAAALREHFGEGRYQELRNDWHRNARDNFIVELSKHGLGKRDLHSNVNFFVRVSVEESGAMKWVPGNTRPGAAIDLRCEMDTLVALSNTPHPLDPARSYGPPPVELSIWRGDPPRGDDVCRTSRPENGRGFELTAAYLREVGETP
jgi:urea carboxylase-associated protein 2